MVIRNQVLGSACTFDCRTSLAVCFSGTGVQAGLKEDFPMSILWEA